jgi:hypothetical protein
MNIIEFVETVRKMRSAQKNYFKTRNRDFLIESKQLETAIDKALAEGVILRASETPERIGDENG